MVLSALFVPGKEKLEAMFFVIEIIWVSITIEARDMNLREPWNRWIEVLDDIGVIFETDVRDFIGEDRKGLVMRFGIAFVVIELVDTHDDIIVMQKVASKWSDQGYISGRRVVFLGETEKGVQSIGFTFKVDGECLICHE